MINSLLYMDLRYLYISRRREINDSEAQDRSSWRKYRLEHVIWVIVAPMEIVDKK